jgi:hypothetical protein
MAMFDEIIALKLAILDVVVRDLLIAQFSGQPDPVSAARAYAELKIAPPSQPDPEMESMCFNVVTPSLCLRMTTKTVPGASQPEMS